MESKFPCVSAMSICSLMTDLWCEIRSSIWQTRQRRQAAQYVCTWINHDYAPVRLAPHSQTLSVRKTRRIKNPNSAHWLTGAVRTCEVGGPSVMLTSEFARQHISDRIRCCSKQKAQADTIDRGPSYWTRSLPWLGSNRASSSYCCVPLQLIGDR